MNFILFSMAERPQPGRDEVGASTPLELFDAVLNMGDFETFYAIDVKVSGEFARTVLFHNAGSGSYDMATFDALRKNDFEYLEQKIVECWEFAQRWIPKKVKHG